MVKKSFTLIEVIFVIVILAFIVTGGIFISSKIYERNLIVSKTLELQFQTQHTIDKLANILYYRIPLTAIGFNQNSNDFKYLGYITEDDNYTIFEWISDSFDIEKEANFSGLADLYASNKPILKAVDFNSSFIKDVLNNTFNTNSDLNNLVGLIFAGTFDSGSQGALYDYNNSFGWHGNRADYVFLIHNYTQNGNKCDLNLTNYDGSEIENKRIYEKFYLADSAYAIALKKDLNASKWNCSDLDFALVPDNAMLLFYNYRPWKGETFCGDTNGTPEGNVSVLANHIEGFYIKAVNNHIEIFIKSKYQRGDSVIKVSKQKVVF